MPNISKTTHYRRIRKAKQLGVSVDELRDGRGKHGHHIRGSDHPKWNNILLSTDGYKKIRVGVYHPLADSNGYAYEHVIIYTSVFGAESVRDRIVHHRNGDKLDNRLENLMLMTVAEHNVHHNTHDKSRDNLGRILGKKKAGSLLDGKSWKEYPR
jgi:hypothetical protein